MTSNDKDECVDVKVDIGVLKTQVLTLSALCNKMDLVIEKLLDQHDRHISKVYSDMNDRRKETDQEIGEIHQRVDLVLDKVQETELRIMAEIKSLKDAISKGNENTKSQFEMINRWKWTFIGGIVVITWLISKTNLDTILHSLK